MLEAWWEYVLGGKRWRVMMLRCMLNQKMANLS